MWKIDPKETHIHKNKHDHAHIYIETCLSTEEGGNCWGRMEEMKVREYG
jgi:hypothetical protein